MLNAQVLQRRAERGLGVAIRAGQEAGVIASQGVSGGPREDYERAGRTVQVDSRRVPTAISPATYFTNSQQASETYAMTDQVSDERFEEVLPRARPPIAVAGGRGTGRAGGPPSTGECRGAAYLTVLRLRRGQSLTVKRSAIAVSAS